MIVLLLLFGAVAVTGLADDDLVPPGVTLVAIVLAVAVGIMMANGVGFVAASDGDGFGFVVR